MKTSLNLRMTRGITGKIMGDLKRLLLGSIVSASGLGALWLAVLFPDVIGTILTITVFIVVSYLIGCMIY